MISNPLETRRYVFADWDNRIIGVLVLPKVVRDVRAFVDFFSRVNLVHPELNGGIFDEWADEREAKYAQALHDWPRMYIYPEESWYFDWGPGGLTMRHSLRYLPGARKKVVRHGVSFRPPRLKLKEAVPDG